MRYTLPAFLLFLFINNGAFGQTDQEAVRILDKFSANALNAPSVSMKFQLINTDLMENTSDTLNGSVILSKDKYMLELPDNIIWTNGVTNWSYLPAEKEVTITKPDKKDDSFQNRPSAVFSLYKKDYKIKLIETRSDSYIIDLYPEDINSDILRIRLDIENVTYDLRSLEYKRKDGIVVTLHVKDYNLKIKPDANTFVFQPAKYKGVEVIDMR